MVLCPGASRISLTEAHSRGPGIHRERGADAPDAVLHAPGWTFPALSVRYECSRRTARQRCPSEASCPQPSRRARRLSPGSRRSSGFVAGGLMRGRLQVHGQAKDAGQALGPKAEGNPRRHQRRMHAASSAERSPSGLRRDLQLPITARTQGMRRQALAQGARQTGRMTWATHRKLLIAFPLPEPAIHQAWRQ
jgi:hypothetical protein